MSIFSSNKEKQEPTQTYTPTSQPVEIKTSTAQNFSTTMTNISNGTVIDGQVKIEGDIKIDGVVKGTITSKGKVFISSTGKVDGDIICQNADISGHVTGKLKIADVLVLKGTAIVDGDVNTGKIVVESGVKFNGNCTMGLANSSTTTTNNTINGSYQKPLSTANTINLTPNS